LVSLLAVAGLTACGDKITPVTITQTTTPSGQGAVHQVTVTPASATLQQGDKITLAASVDADASITDRTVTWTSANTAIASVDASGVVTAGTTAGTTTITAKSKADASVSGAALITVLPAGGTGALPTISISTVNQTVCVAGGACTSVPANLGSVAGQLDVTVNLDPGSQKVSAVQLIMNCTGAGNSGIDTVVTQQTLTTSNVVSAEAASAPVTLSFNTGSFNATTGAVAFRNGTCTMKAKAIAGNGTTTSTAQNITLANTDVVVGSVTASTNKINPVTGAVWSGGTVTVTATPILYTPNRAVRTMTLTFAGKAAPALGTSTSGSLSGQQTASFVDGNGATVASPATDINNITNAAATATFAAIDTLGTAIVNTVAGANTCAAAALCTQTSVLAGATAAIPTLRLDTQKPTAGSLPLNPNALQGTVTSWLGANFRFVADSAAGFVGPDAGTAIAGGACLGNNGANNPVTCNLDNGGVDSVTAVFFFNTSGSRTSGASTLITAGSGLSETVTNTTNTLAMITTDLLGNADTSFAVNNASPRTAGGSAFGVDKTGPAVTMAGAADQSLGVVVGGTGNISATVTDALSGPAAQQLVAQVALNSTVSSSSQPSNNTIYTNTGAAGTSAVNAAPASGCIIGRFNRTSGAANADPAALPIFNASGTQVGTCSPTPYNLAGGTTVSANNTGAAGYVTTIIVPIDQAGNRAATQTIRVAEDGTNPTVGALDLPTSISGGSSPVIPAAAFDNLDVVTSAVQISYNGFANPLQYPAVAGPGVAFDNVLTPGSSSTSTTVSPTIQVFARNVQSGAAAPGNPTQASNGPTNVQVGVADEVGRNNASALVNLTATTIVTQPGSTSPWSTNFTGTTTIAANNATVSVCPTAGCAGGAAAANPTTTTLTVTAQGTTSVFANPFTTVQIWYQVGGAGPWFLAGTASAGSSRDTGVGGSRFWDYTFTWTPPKNAQFDVVSGAAPAFTTSGTTVNVMGLGINSTGDAIFTAPITITFTNP
jgi:hypothetical protein